MEQTCTRRHYLIVAVNEKRQLSESRLSDTPFGELAELVVRAEIEAKVATGVGLYLLVSLIIEVLLIRVYENQLYACRVSHWADRTDVPQRKIVEAQKYAFPKRDRRELTEKQKFRMR